MQTPLTTTQAAALVGVSAMTLKRWRDAGEGPPHARLVNGFYVYDETEVRAWMAERDQHAER